MGTAFQLGPIEVRWYSILIVIGVMAGVFLATIEARRRGENPEHILSVAAIAGVPTARWICGVLIILSIGGVAYRRYRLRHTA
ncbi:MAG: prolipoprotein diacylglyceryl transferase [Chloroflexota bacterium]|nr:prolipoprotein diacylglyceryl transferase [Chloroflexota bacterium]